MSTLYQDRNVIRLAKRLGGLEARVAIHSAHGCHAANLEVYGFDIVQTAEHFCERIGAR